MLNHIAKDNFKNRKRKALPKKRCNIEIIVTSAISGDETFQCQWIPAKEIKHPFHTGFIGTATIRSGKFSGIGFHAWETSDSEFIYYRILN